MKWRSLLSSMSPKTLANAETSEEVKVLKEDNRLRKAVLRHAEETDCKHSIKEIVREALE